MTTLMLQAGELKLSAAEVQAVYSSDKVRLGEQGVCDDISANDLDAMLRDEGQKVISSCCGPVCG